MPEVVMPYVLIVDDDESIRRILKNIVESMGFNVALCETLEEVQNLFPENEADAKKVDLAVAIVDGKFPWQAGTAPRDSAGAETVAYLRRVRPTARYLAMSSRAPEKITWGDISLPKPFTLAQLKTALTELTSATQREPS